MQVPAKMGKTQDLDVKRSWVDMSIFWIHRVDILSYCLLTVHCSESLEA